jgi:hypothetical protein
MADGWREIRVFASQRPRQQKTRDARKHAGFEGFRTVSVSYVERVMGIEPTLFAWEARVLPLNDTREAM